MSKQDELSHVIRCVQHHGTVIGNRTIDEHWIVNGVRFNHMPSESEVEEAYTRPTPQADEVKRLEEDARRYRYIRDVDCFILDQHDVRDWDAAIDAAISHKEEAE